MKRSLFLLICFLTAGVLAAQDMPPLPDLPNQGGNAGMPQAVTAPAAPVAATDASAVPALPALPSSSSPAPAASASPALPALPDQSAAPAAAPANPSLPALPDQSAGAAPAANPALPALPNQSAAPAASANPPLPGDQAQPAAQPAPAEEAKAPEAKPAKKGKAKIAPWKVSKWRPNAIFDGLVVAKGGNETSRIAWTSQEVLNAFEFHGFKVVHEKGAYPGQGQKQFRTLTFKAPKSKLTVNVYIKGEGKKVWVRVRPSQPPLPAAFTKAQVENMRKVNTVAFGLLKKKFGRRMSPYYHWSSFEPQAHSQAVADEAEQIED